MKTGKVAIYCRLCFRDRAKLKKQKNLLIDFAMSEGFDLFKIYSEFGSGLTLNRPAFTKLNKAIKDGEIDTVIMRDITRIGRNILLVQSWMKEMEETNVKMIFLW